MIIRSSVLYAEIKFHTDYHGVGHGWICYELFCLKREIRGSSVDIRVKSCMRGILFAVADASPCITRIAWVYAHQVVCPPAM